MAAGKIKMVSPTFEVNTKGYFKGGAINKVGLAPADGMGVLMTRCEAGYMKALR